ncbi:MAG: outer membrane protein assembly factor BamE [Marinobacterium sp.]|nr:outer membrane protein assembly factor BamE [Marinobacterium sp.]
MIKNFTCVAVLTLVLTGCSGFPGVYKIDIPQGNVVTQEMVNKLRPGMTRRQVRFVMGTPLVEDSFNASRWDYIYTLKDTDDSFTRQRMTLTFDADGRLEGLSGDFRPDAAVR